MGVFLCGSDIEVQLSVVINQTPACRGEHVWMPSATPYRCVSMETALITHLSCDQRSFRIFNPSGASSWTQIRISMFAHARSHAQLMVTATHTAQNLHICRTYSSHYSRVARTALCAWILPPPGQFITPVRFVSLKSFCMQTSSIVECAER